jgi:membrane fusion protein (multidrug efflux system)
MRMSIPSRLAGTLAALSLACMPGCKKDEAPPPAAPLAVKAATILTRDVPVYVEAIGETRGNTEVEIRARVEGFIDSVDFAEGQPVRRGQRLYTIDPKPFEAAVARAKAELAGTEADLARAQQDVARYEPLVAKNAISREDYDTAVAVERAQRSAVDAAKAALESAKIDLGYTTVTAPTDGLVGKTEVYAGTLVGHGESTLLTRISKIDPIHVRFTIPERDYLYYARQREERQTKGAAELPLELVLSDGSVHPHPGQFVFIDRNVDPKTGTILLEASFPNPGGIVRPGQFGRVRAAVEVKHDAALVPQRAVQELQGIYNVAVVGQDGTIEMRMVEVGERIGSLWVVDSGLKPGERVVVEGLQKVRPGVKVEAQMVTIEDSAGKQEPAPATGT